MDWGLEAVVRGATDNPTRLESFELQVDDYGHNFEFSPPSVSFEDDFLEGAKVFDGLEEVYKPFYPGFDQCKYSSSGAIQETRGVEGRDVMSPVATTTDVAIDQATKVKRRNQRKRVVKDVTTDDTSSDKWAWRKYGQKLIKGSPYPRNYYRCSSSRECLARKQIERSTSDPNTFNVSYTEEHNHEQPTRRNALAGSIRSKFSTASASTTTTKKKSSSSVSVDLGLVESPINSSGVNSPAYSARESDECKMVNPASGGGLWEEFSFLDCEEMGWN